jgi:hypothetical protein
MDSNPNLEPKVHVHEEPRLELDLEILHEFFLETSWNQCFFKSKISLFSNPK